MSIYRSFGNELPDIDGQRILITGGTGSFGQAFLHRILNGYPNALVVIFSRDEQKQYELEGRLDPKHRERVRLFLGDVRDVDRLESAMRNVDLVIHAAALKHVSAAEYNPFECVKTNINGGENVVTAAIRTGVRRVIALSTDKAASPLNLYGASKLASDKIFIAANNLAGSQDIRFSIVRYGNVLGSRGSVVPFFQRLINEGADFLPITHPDMTRFWITLKQGVEFVLSSLQLMSGGEIFVPKIPSMKVVDVARTLAPDLPHRIVGIRPGEKLHEVMITADDARTTMELEDRYILEPVLPLWTSDYRSHKDATRVPTNFEYSSNFNSEWLDRESFLALIQGQESS